VGSTGLHLTSEGAGKGEEAMERVFFSPQQGPSNPA
jgi:hypothetical protein